jgi:hypothetical protein
MPRPRKGPALLTPDELRDQAVCDELAAAVGVRLALILLGHSVYYAVNGQSPSWLRSSASRRHQQVLREWRAQRASAGTGTGTQKY